MPGLIQVAAEGPNTTLTFVSLVALLALSAVFSGSEIALVSLSPARVRLMIRERRRGAHAVRTLKERPNRMLITILVGNNLVNIGASVLATAWATQAFGSAALGIVTGVLTLLVLVFGEIFPKAFAQRHAEVVALILARPLLLLMFLLFPIVLLLELLLKAAVRGGSARAGRVQTLQELRAMIDLAAEKGALEVNVSDVLAGAVQLSTLEAGDIMTPRSKIVAIGADASLDELRKSFVQSLHSRIPVHDGGLDRMIGYVTMRDLLGAEERCCTAVREMTLQQAIRVPAGMPVDDVLLELQKSKQWMAFVEGKNGVIEGLITVENVLEEIVGELFDEKDRFKQFVRPLGPDRWEVLGDCTLHDLRRHFAEFEPAEPPFKSVGKLFTDRIDGEPAVGRELAGPHWKVRVNRMRERAIASRIVERISPPGP